jgi:mono/diheme cytochrome c family protein
MSLQQGDTLNKQQKNDTVTTQKELTREDLVRGERLFYGLVYLENPSLNCAGCHSTTVAAMSDTINWNPNALEISLKYIDKSVDDLSRVLLNPAGGKLPAAHAGFKFTPEEVVLIKSFMDRFPEKGLQKEKPVITNLLLFIIASMLFIGALTDLAITKKLKKWIALSVLTVTTVYITWILARNAILIGRSPGYSPDQPVKFSHVVHVGQNGTDCIYCHSYAPRSMVSGIPSGNVCMNCHLIVRTGKRSGAFEIAKVTDSYEKKIPVRWIRVHNLPDHVYFNHSQHVNAGGINCAVCHGDVATMDRIVQVSDLSMGWCVNCHRSRKVNFGNNFYTQYTQLSEKMENGKIDSVLVSQEGGTDCMRCHY